MRSKIPLVARYIKNKFCSGWYIFTKIGRVTRRISAERYDTYDEACLAIIGIIIINDNYANGEN